MFCESWIMMSYKGENIIGANRPFIRYKKSGLNPMVKLIALKHMCCIKQ